MKKIVKSNSALKLPIVVNVDVVIGFDPSQNIAAVTTFDDRELPIGELLPADKHAVINSQALEDYHSFVDTVEDLLDYYGLEVYYRNESPDNSFYYGLLGKDENGKLLFKFDFKLRVSSHQAKRSKESQKHKKEQKVALNRIANGLKPQPITKSVVVNNEQFISYEDAYIYVNDVIAKVLKTLGHKLPNE